MAVIYLFDAQKNLRRPVREGVQEIIHSEGEYTAITQILAKDTPQYGDYFGFECADGRFRLFWINAVEIDDEAGTCMLNGTDAAIAELEGGIVTNLPLQNTTALQAITAAAEGTGWSIGRQTGDGPVNTESAYFATRWTVIKRAAAAGGVRAVPYYEFSGNQITGKKIDVLDKTPVFSGLIYTRKRGAQNIHITREGVPYGRVFPIGKIIGDSEPPEQVTIADAVWSTANGDPADKPAGQLYIDLPGAISTAEYVYEDKREENPTRLMEKAFQDLESTQKPKASGTANLTEMQRMPGYEHMAAQMWEMAVIRAETGEMVETTIINIERYHVHEELTKITVGDEDSGEELLENMLADMQSMIADTAKVAGGGRAGAGKAKTMVLEAEELIQLNSEKIELNAEQITLRALTEDVTRLEDETLVNFREVYLDIDENRAEISATNTIVDNLGNEVEGMNATLIVHSEQISAKASQFEVDELGNRVTLAEGELIVQAGQISARVERNGVIGAINLTPEEAKIQAARIDLVGYVTASAFEAEMAEIGNIFAGYSEISALGISGNLYAQNANIPGNVSLLGRVTNLVSLTMGSVASHTIYGAGTDTALSLQHSHAVTVNDDGTITLAEVSSSGGSFKIADTKAYKEGVSAAEGRGYNNGYAAGKTAYQPTVISRTGYDTSGKTVTVKAANGHQDLLTGVVISASEIYDAAYNDGHSAGYNSGYSAGQSAGYNSGYTAGHADGYEEGVLDGYDNGWDDAVDAVTVGYSSFTITNTAANTFYARASIWAKVDGETAASTTITKTQTINVGQ